MAIVVLGGLITSTFLNLIVVPAGYSLVFRGSSRLPRVSEIDTDESSQRQNDSKETEQ